MVNQGQCWIYFFNPFPVFIWEIKVQFHCLNPAVLEPVMQNILDWNSQKFSWVPGLPEYNIMPCLPSCFWDLGWPGIFYVTLAGLKLIAIRLPFPECLGLKHSPLYQTQLFIWRAESFHWTSSWWTRLEGQQISELGPMSTQNIVPKNGIGGSYNHVWLQCLALFIVSVTLWVDGRQVTNWGTSLSLQLFPCSRR